MYVLFTSYYFDPFIVINWKNSFSIQKILAIIFPIDAIDSAFLMRSHWFSPTASIAALFQCSNHVSSIETNRHIEVIGVKTGQKFYWEIRFLVCFSSVSHKESYCVPSRFWSSHKQTYRVIVSIQQTIKTTPQHVFQSASDHLQLLIETSVEVTIEWLICGNKH